MNVVVKLLVIRVNYEKTIILIRIIIIIKQLFRTAFL